MTGLELIWRDKTDIEVAEAARTLSEYTEEAVPVIRAEMQRRGVRAPKTDPGPAPTPNKDMRCVFVASGLDEGNQVVAFLRADGIASALRGESTTKTHGFTVDGLGRLEVLVTESDEEKALALLSSADGGEFQLGEDQDIEA